MSKRGFTLIELLSVILILGIIAVIAIPTVNNIINEAKRNSFKTTMQNIAKAIETDCQVQRIKSEDIVAIYTFSDTGVSPKLDVKGTLPISGTAKVDDECNVTFRNVTNGKYRATKLSADNNIIINEVDKKVCHATQGDGSNIGDVITCGTESFYVYDATGNTIKMLAKYNLKVGGVYRLPPSYSYTHYTEAEMTYMQDENMKGRVDGQTVYYGISAFSNSQYHGVDESSYEGSLVEKYVNKYSEILINMGVNVIDESLITYDELIALGCVRVGACPSDKSFLYETSYWTKTPRSKDDIWRVFTDSSFSNVYYNVGGGCGVRPVITILKSDI